MEMEMGIGIGMGMEMEMGMGVPSVLKAEIPSRLVSTGIHPSPVKLMDHSKTIIRIDFKLTVFGR